MVNINLYKVFSVNYVKLFDVSTRLSSMDLNEKQDPQYLKQIDK